MPTKSVSFLHKLCWKLEPLDRVERVLSSVTAAPERLILEILPRLGCINRQLVNDWTVSQAIADLGLSDSDLQTFQSEIRNLYQTFEAEEIALEDLATRLQPLLARYVDRSETVA